MFRIEDEMHAEQWGPFATRAEAMAELRRRAAMPWDQEPNQAPCTNWRNCGRDYVLVEYDDTGERLLSETPVLNISAAEIRWLIPPDDPGG